MKQKEIKKYPHVVHIITRLDLGGAQKVCLLLVDGIKKEGGSVSLISGIEGELVEDAKKFDSVFLLKSFKHKISLKNIFSEFKAFFDIWLLLIKLKKKHSNIIVHTHTPKAGIIGRFAAFFAGIKKRVHTIHGLSFNKYQKWFVRDPIMFVEWVASLVTTHFICVSKADYDVCYTIYPSFSKKSSIIYPAVDFKIFQQTGDKKFKAAKKSGVIAIEGISYNEKKNKEKVVIGCISCFKPLKNLIDLFEAFKEIDFILHDKFDLVLEVAGDGKLLSYYEEWIEKNNLKDKIKLLGWRHYVNSLMSGWDIFTMTSLKEGLPCSIVEARFAKLPVVAYKVGGIPEVIENGKNGLLASPHDVETFTSNLLKVVKNAEYRKKLAKYPDNLSSFQNDIMAREHINLYKSL